MAGVQVSGSLGFFDPIAGYQVPSDPSGPAAILEGPGTESCQSCVFGGSEILQKASPVEGIVVYPHYLF